MGKDAPSLRNRRVLVVDDGDTNRKLVQLVLGRAGALVKQAENGKQGIERAMAETFDIILMDMQMPVMDGYTATRKLRERGLDIPIVAMTANAMKGDEAKCLEAGCSAYLAKPIDQDQLLAIVASSTSNKAEKAAPATPTPTQSVPAHAAPTRPAAKPSAASVAVPPGKLISTLPMDDEEFREIVVQFKVSLKQKLGEMRNAVAAGNHQDLASLAHWLKGTSGTVGFPAFAEVAKRLEQNARSGRPDGTIELLSQLDEMGDRIALE